MHFFCFGEGTNDIYCNLSIFFKIFNRTLIIGSTITFVLRYHRCIVSVFRLSNSDSLWKFLLASPLVQSRHICLNFFSAMPELSVGERLVCLVNFAVNFVFEMHWVLKLFFTMCEGTLHIAQNKYGKFNPFF